MGTSLHSRRAEARGMPGFIITSMHTPIDIRDDLTRPSAYPPPHPDRIELRETHASYTFLTERDVYKVKKPVDLGFLDFSSIAARQRACETEVVLNARLAPAVYLGVVPVRRGGDGAHLHSDDGEIVDWAVHMRRLPDALRADVRLLHGTLAPSHFEILAEHVADFHARCATNNVIASYGSPERIARNVRDNFVATRGEIDHSLSTDEAREIERWQTDFLDAKMPLLAERCAHGFVRDGHGDLRLDHVYFDDGSNAHSRITILDCIEFSSRLRAGDVCADIAFLSMDLAAHGRRDLAEHFLARYARRTNDYDLYALVDFYESYRATVRAKVSMLLAQTGSDGVARAHARAEARRHFVLALACARRSILTPAVVAVGGAIASGKSTIADALAECMSAPVVDTDRARKAMLGVGAREPVHAPPFQGSYDHEATAKTYAETLRRAAVVLSSGRNIVIDASFRDREQRRFARALARRAGVPFLFVECRAPRDVCFSRLEKREREGSVSDGRRAIWDDFMRSVEPIVPGEMTEHEHILVDTTKSVTENLHALKNHIGTWPRGFAG